MKRNYASKFTESEEISSRFRQMIKEHGITQRKFCEQTGISAGHLSKVLTGRAIPSGSILISIANKGYDVNWVLSESSSKSKLEEREKEMEKLIYQINEIEILVKKNSSNSLNIISDFILNKSIKSNNLSL